MRRDVRRLRTENWETSPSPSMKVSSVGSHVPRSAKYLGINIHIEIYIISRMGFIG